MVEKLEKFFYGLLSSRISHRSFINDHEKYLYLISYAACVYAATMNLFLSLFHLAISILPLLIISLVGFLIDICLFKLIDKGHYLLFGLLFSATVIAYVMSCAICIGTNNFIVLYLLVTLMMQIIIPYAHISVRAMVIFVLWLCMIALIFITHYTVPLWDIGTANIILTLFNIQLSFIVTVIQLTIGQLIWGTIIKFNEKELAKSKGEAYTDPLTGLFNRRYAHSFFERLRTDRFEQAQVWCVAMLDLDDFKVVNDTYGHQVGDGVLIWIGNFLTTNLRKTDLVFRWGGEEFLILLKSIDVSTAFRTLDKLRSKIELDHIETPHGENLQVTVTIGVCQLDVDNVEQSIDTCDRLMYEGKASGKNIVVM